MWRNIENKTNGTKDREPISAEIKAKLFSKPIVVATSVLFMAMVDYFDFLIGDPIHQSALMLAPIAFTAWYAGLYYGLGLSVLGACYAILNYAMNPTFYRSIWSPLGNFMILLVFFAIFCWVLDKLKGEHEAEHLLAYTDHLSGLMNVRAFFEAAQRELHRSKRHNHPFTLCVLDLDNFKKVNDTMGHMKGDELLKRLALVLKSKLRDTDMAARLGGDEFVVLLPETGLSAADSLLAKLHKSLVDGMKMNGAIPVTPSMGVLICYKIPDKLDEAIRAADTLMYEAKSAGRNQIKTGILGRRETDPKEQVPITGEKEMTWKADDGGTRFFAAVSGVDRRR
jgi:diguanylate cyclase (GGDEF)-like protein